MADTVDPIALQALLEKLLETLPEPSNVPELSIKQQKVLRQMVNAVIQRLHKFAESLDPIGRPQFVFDP